MAPAIKIAPSLLAADFSRLAEEVRKVEAGGAEWLHLDVMDGHFVPNITVGPFIVQALRRVTKLRIDAHLMVTDPDAYVGPFIEAGADSVSFHIEASDDPYATLARIHTQGASAGIAINPPTSLDRMPTQLWNKADLILVMTVNPGFGGQSFMPEALEKVRALRAACPELDIQVDGGINAGTTAQAAAAGANVFVAGTAIFRAKDPAEAVLQIRREAEGRA